MIFAPEERARLVAESGAAIRIGSRSFHMASRLFDRETRERAWLLYRWCRHCDDVADGQHLGHDAEGGGPDPAARLAMLRDRSARALAGERQGETPFDGLAVVAAECGLPARFVADHLDGFAMDAAGWRPADEADLILYCYRVAGAVGCMMAVVMGVAPDDEAVLDRAADLGIAFQLGNIARDVREDALIGRTYLPQSWLAGAGLSADALLDPGNRGRVGALVRRLASLSARYEASGRAGARHLPFRAGWAVLAAARIYGAIARRAAADPQAALTARIVIRRRRKAAHALAALAETFSEPAPAPRDGLWTRAR